MALSRKWQWTKQLLQQDENIRGDTFEWNIPRFLKNESTMTKHFGWGKYKCSLSINRKLTGNLYNIYLRGSDPTFFKNVHFYKLSLINRQRQIFLSASGNQFANTMNSDVHLMRFCANHFMANAEEALTICLFLNTWTDKGAHDKCIQTTPDVISEKKPSKFLKALSNDFGRLYESKRNTDCVLRVGTEQFLAHRAVLSARSTVFADLFHHGTPESSIGVVNILQVDGAVVSDVLYFIYTGKIRGLTTDSAALMYAMANKLGVTDLKEKCLYFLKCSLKVGNICDAALLAHNYGETELEEKVVRFMEGRLDEVQESVEWKILSDYKPSLTTKLLDSASAKKCGEGSLDEVKTSIKRKIVSYYKPQHTTKLYGSASARRQRPKKIAKRNKKLAL